MKNSSHFTNTLKSNLLYAYAAQGVSTALNIGLTLLMPKFMEVDDYGYWQLIVFYANYLGIFYLGLNDGMYLCIGGKHYKELNHSLIGTECKAFFVIHVMIALFLALITTLFVNDPNRRYVIYIITILLPFFNFKGILSQTFQAVNQTKVYAVSILVEKTVMFLLIGTALFCGIRDFRCYVLIYVFAILAATIYCIVKAKQIVLAHLVELKCAFNDAKLNIKYGMPLMISSFASMLIVGSSRQVIDTRWGVEDFSKISLSITIMSLFLVFLNQSSLVLFPSIRRLKENNQAKLYSTLVKIVDIIMPAILIFYIPVSFFVVRWLPNYMESVKYLGIMLPICIFDGKMSLIGNTYFKVLRLQKELLCINVCTLVINLLLSSIGAWVFNSIDFIIVGLAVSIAIRSILAEIYLNRAIGVRADRASHAVVWLSFVFVLLNQLTNHMTSFAVYLALYGCFYFAQRKRLGKTLSELKLSLNQ